MNKQQLKNVIAEYQSRKDLEGRIRRLRDAAERITTQLTGMPRGSSGEDKLAAIVSEIADLETELCEKIVRIEREMQEADKLIDELPDETHRRLLRLRYYEGLSWKKIGKLMHYDVSTLIRKHKNALKELEGK